ncbi:hypothetical protein BGX29_011953 [Mortierella sp. GBA35]|nr:hypothetical protein BGX29_011953 [Mortierella sp. GBA35]
MSTSCERFFDIFELVNLLISHLAKADLSRLARTNREMHKRCVPLLYKNLGSLYGRETNRIFKSNQSIHAFAQKIRQARMLKLGVYELVYYYNCVLASEEIYSHIIDSPASRPIWLPPPDIRTCQVVALPPMNHQTQLSVSFFGPGGGLYTMQGVETPHAVLAQLCWLISHNQRLTLLNLSRVPVMDPHGCRLLGRTISGLSGIKELKLSIVGKMAGSFQLVEAAPERQEPLVKLEDLAMWGIDDWASTTDTDICSNFAHCPNLQYPDIPTFTGSHDFSAIGVFIGKECSRIQTLRYSLHGFKVHDSLPHKFMDALPPQQLAEFEYNGLFSNISTLE